MNARDLMKTSPRTISVDGSVATALEILQSLEVRHLPVVDEDNGLVGMISDRDLGRLVVQTVAHDERQLLFLRNDSVAGWMSGDVVSVDVEADIHELIELMIRNKIGAVPVVDGRARLVGMVSYVDVLRALEASAA
jgi:CBS-domain-containing membrane protein